MQRLDPHPTVQHRRGLRGGAADIQGQDVASSDPRAGFGRRQDPRHRSRLEQVDRRARRAFERGHPAAGANRVQRTGHAGLPDPGPQRRQVPRHHRLHVGGQDGRARPLVLAPLPAHLVRGHDLDAWEQFPEHLGRPPLVRGVRPRVEEADGQGPDAGLPDRAGERTQLALVEGHDDVAPVRHPLEDLEPQPAGDEWHRLRVGQVVDVGPVGPPDLQHVTEPSGGDQRGRDAPAFGDGVDDHGGPVNQRLHGRSGDAGSIQGGHHPVVQLGRGRGRLGHDELAGRDVDGRQVGERPPDVDGHPVPDLALLGSNTHPCEGQYAERSRPHAAEISMGRGFDGSDRAPGQARASGTRVKPTTPATSQSLLSQHANRSEGGVSPANCRAEDRWIASEALSQYRCASSPARSPTRPSSSTTMRSLQRRAKSRMSVATSFEVTRSSRCPRAKEAWHSTNDKRDVQRGSASSSRPSTVSLPGSERNAFTRALASR